MRHSGVIRARWFRKACADWLSVFVTDEEKRRFLKDWIKIGFYSISRKRQPYLLLTE